MAWTTLHWFSSVIGKQTTTQVLLPETGKPPFATFYLLHGLSDDASIWHRRTRIEWYVRDLPLIVVMPDGYRSFYTKAEAGPDFARHIGEELPDFIERHFQARPTRDARAIGGFSMGGYGALRVGLGYADRFCSINSHAGAVTWNDYTSPRLTNRGPEFINELRRIFGDKPAGTDHDLLMLAKRVKKAGKLPKLKLDCGVGDFLIEDNREFHRDLVKAKIPHRYDEFPGEHNWDYCDLQIQAALQFHAKNLGLLKK